MMRYRLIGCEIFYREICHVVSRAKNRVDVSFLDKGLHDIGCASMCQEIRYSIQLVDETDYDAILLGYGLCNNGVIGLAATHIPIVIPRGHDCISILIGNKERYMDYFTSNPGVYFQSTGWIERGQASELGQLSLQKMNCMGESYEELEKRYGSENAEYLYKMLGDPVHNYSKCTFICTGLEPDQEMENHARQEAEKRNWSFETIPGDISLLQRLVDGDWNEDEFLIVPPGYRIALTYDDDIITVEKCNDEEPTTNPVPDPA